MHWDGSTWEVVDTPDPSDGNCILYAVAAFATDDVWAVGWWDDGTDEPRARDALGRRRLDAGVRR
jgi:hypothetical protein